MSTRWGDWLRTERESSSVDERRISPSSPVEVMVASLAWVRRGRRTRSRLRRAFMVLE